MSNVTLKKTEKFWIISYVYNSGRADEIARFRNAGLQRQLVCNTLSEVVCHKMCNEVVFDMAPKDAYELWFYCTDAIIRPALAEFCVKNGYGTDEICTSAQGGI